MSCLVKNNKKQGSDCSAIKMACIAAEANLVKYELLVLKAKDREETKHFLGPRKGPLACFLKRLYQHR